LTIFLFLLALDSNLFIEETGVFQALQPGEAQVRANGDVYILNFRESQVVLFSADGQLKRKIGRKGKGPGEFTFPAQFFVSEDKLYIYDFLENQLSAFKANGDYLNRYTIKDRDVALARTTNGWVVGTWGMIAMGRPCETYWTDETFSERVVLAKADNCGYSDGSWSMDDDKTGMEVGFFSRLATYPSLTASPDGKKVFLGDMEVFKIQVIDATKKVVSHTIQRDDKPVPFDKEWGTIGLDEVKKKWRQEGSTMKVVVNSPEYFPVIRTILFDPDGNMMVNRWRGRPDKKSYAITIDEKGKELPAKWSWEAAWRTAGTIDGHAYVTLFDDSEEAGIARVPLAELEAFVKANPIVDKDSSRSISVGD